MHHRLELTALGAACALLLAACGGSSHDPAPPVAEPPPAPTSASLTLLSSTTRAMDSVAFHGGSAYLSLANGATETSSVVRASLPLAKDTTWNPVGMGACGMAARGDFIMRSPRLKMAGGDLWLMQPWYDAPETAGEHSACTLDASTASFVPRDRDLQTCNAYFCETLTMYDIKQQNGRLYANAGGGSNLFTSNDKGATWQVVLGQKASMMCYASKFHVFKDRVMVGGECPLDMAFVDAYQLNADGSALASEDKLKIGLPDLENRNVQFIEPVEGSATVFVGVEGGLLRSTDNGNNFKFVIHEPLEGGKGYPYIKAFLPVKSKPGFIVVGGFDKANGRPYLAWSPDGGMVWNDISKQVPGYDNVDGDENSVGAVSAIVEDPQGRILVVANARSDGQGRLLQLNFSN